MAMKMHEVSYLILFDPAEAKKRILTALRATGMHRGNAAKRLGCRHSTLIRWVAALGLEPEIKAMIARAITDGTHHGFSVAPGRGGAGRKKVTKEARQRLRKTG